VDDGWQHAIGDWAPNEKFPSGMGGFAAQILRAGRTPGIWLAPLIVTPSSALFRQHPDWLLRDLQQNLVSAGFNWGEPLYALDTTIPAVLEWLSALMMQVRAWGYDYVKLDFLYAGALPGDRHTSISREQAYRQGLETMRKALGDVYLLTCGAPILPSLDLCDGIRIGPDVASHWNSYRDDVLLSNFAIPGTRNAIRTTVNRLWLKPLVHTDPDVAYFASNRNTMTTEQEKILRDLALVCDYKATSDLPAWLSETERAELVEFLDAGKTSLNDVDFSTAMPIPETSFAQEIFGKLLGWLGSFPAVMKLFRWLDEQEIKANLAD
jgi:alpha-galactosidase